MTYKVVGISFDHMHMGDLLRMVDAHPDAEIAGLYDPDRAKMQGAIDAFNVPEDRVFTDFDTCMAAGPYDLAILCCATADHAVMTERLAPHGVHIHVEKPFAANAADARRMMKAMEGTGKIMAINWPLAWVESHLTAKRLINEGMIGALREVHFYDGNRGPLYHLADKVEVSPEEVERQKPDSWWYKAASGGGGDVHRGSDAADRSGSTRDCGGAIPLGPQQDGDALGYVYRSVERQSAANLRLRFCGHRGHYCLARLCQPRNRSDPRPARAARDRG
jgi:predicted dehydrogenase